MEGFMQNSRKILALQYAKQGIAVFPCSKSKAPIPKNGFKSATTDITAINRWWSDHPDAFIGSPNDQFVVIDVDNTKNDAVRLMRDHVINDMKNRNIIKPTTPMVNTLSGGNHFYFKKDETLTRKIRNLPCIDICANGGYVILPDNESYTVEGYKNPWEMFDNLEEFDKNQLEEVILGSEALNTAAKSLEKMDGTEPTRRKKKKKNEEFSDRYKLTDDGVVYKQEDSSAMYSKADPDTYQAKNPSQKILNKDGKIRIERGQIETSAFLMEIFHNQEVQKKLGKFVGIEVPPVGESILQHSIFPGHVDKRKSMGVRWRRDNACLIIRDFANHHSDQKNNLDFNIVRLHATIKGKTLAPRFTGHEFNIHFLNMLYDAGMLDIDFIDYHLPINELSGCRFKVADGVRRLVAFNRLFSESDGFVCMTRAFGSAFCAISPSSVSSSKTWLMEHGYLFDTGFLNTRGGDNPYFNTTTIAIVDSPTYIPSYEINTVKAQKQLDTKDELNRQKNEKRRKNKEDSYKKDLKDLTENIILKTLDEHIKELAETDIEMYNEFFRNEPVIKIKKPFKTLLEERLSMARSLQRQKAREEKEKKFEKRNVMMFGLDSKDLILAQYEKFGYEYYENLRDKFDRRERITLSERVFLKNLDREFFIKEHGLVAWRRLQFELEMELGGEDEPSVPNDAPIQLHERMECLSHLNSEEELLNDYPREEYPKMWDDYDKTQKETEENVNLLINPFTFMYEIVYDNWERLKYDLVIE
jgi:hypothetical protein